MAAEGRFIEKTSEELRSFGYIMATALLLFSAAALFRDKVTAFGVLFAGGAAFALLGVLAPTKLRTAERLWMGFGKKLSVITTFGILSGLYFLCLTPLGLLVRLLGKDLLNLKIDKGAKSYWQPVEANGPGTRPFLPY